MTGVSHTCSSLTQLIAAAEGQPDRVAQAINDHLQTCPTCTREEAALSALMRRYLQQEAPLPADVEAHLMAYLCTQDHS
mgnify:CR=1 FL=1